MSAQQPIQDPIPPSFTVNTTNGFTGIQGNGGIFAHLEKCPGGHLASPEYAEYPDGETVTYCTVCNDRIVVPRVPGGPVPERVKELLGDLAEAPGESNLGRFLAVKADLDEAAEALDECRRLLRIAERMVRQEG